MVRFRVRKIDVLGYIPRDYGGMWPSGCEKSQRPCSLCTQTQRKQPVGCLDGQLTGQVFRQPNNNLIMSLSKSYETTLQFSKP